MYINRILLLALVILYAFAPLVAAWIEASGTQWFRPHLIWLGVIAAGAVAISLDSPDEH